MPYQQTTTANPYGFRPWRTRLYTTFDDFSFLKQPQNTILRGDQTMRPEIYKPPEMRGLGAILVTGSGRVLRGRRRSLRGLGVIMADGGFTDVYRPYPYGSVSPIVRPISTFPVLPGPMPVAPISNIIVRGPISTAPMPGPMPVYRPPGAMPIEVPPILPPSIVPPPPTIVRSSPDGTVYSLPGAAGVPGSPFPPPSPGELPAPGAAVTSSTPIATGGSLAEWFNSQTWIAGIPNGYLAIAGVGALYFFSKRRGR